MLKADEIKLQPETGCARDGSKLLMHMEFAQSIQNSKGGTWNGIEINRLQTTSRPLPLLLRISGTANIETAVNSTLCGLLIHALIGGGWGWTAALTINIEKLSNSSFAGVIVDKHELDSPEPEPGKPRDESSAGLRGDSAKSFAPWFLLGPGQRSDRFPQGNRPAILRP